KVANKKPAIKNRRQRQLKLKNTREFGKDFLNPQLRETRDRLQMRLIQFWIFLPRFFGGSDLVTVAVASHPSGTAAGSAAFSVKDSVFPPSLEAAVTTLTGVE